MLSRPIYVTQPYLPPLEEFMPYLQEIWGSKVLTNRGPFHEELEQELCNYLNVKHLCLFTNGTIALVSALQALRISGEVITTPYSFPATTHALVWNRIRPVFVDIDARTLNMDPHRIEAAIGRETRAILPVHCYGHPCDVEAIQRIADGYNLKVIYDAAHAFGVRRATDNLLHHGDLSVLSFHATKIFNTFEGGAVICPDEKVKRHIDNLKNFGFLNETTVVESGINGKMSEFNAALGLLQLKHITTVLHQRQRIDHIYRQRLRDVPGIRCLEYSEGLFPNYAYFPIFVEDEYPLSRDKLYEYLKEHNVYGRRYFYPLISDMPMYRNIPSANPTNLPIAQKLSRSVICLPIYPSLSDRIVVHVTELVKNAFVRA